MQGVTKIRPTPGVLSAFDERGCAVVDTLHDHWMYLTGDEAWVWQSVEVTGTAGHLSHPGDIAVLRYFIESGLMIVEDDTTSVPFTYLDPGEYEYEDADRRSPLCPEPPGRHVLHRAWWQAARLERKAVHRIIQRTRSLHAGRHRYLDEPALKRFHLLAVESAPWWIIRSGRCTPRAAALVTCLAAHHVKARVDLSFGMTHHGRGPAWWCSVPQGSAGRPDGSLLISSV